MAEGMKLPQPHGSHLVTKENASEKEVPKPTPRKQVPKKKKKRPKPRSQPIFATETTEYSDTFEDTSYEEKGQPCQYNEPLSDERYTDVELGSGMLLKVPIGQPDVNCKVEPLCAEERTERLDDINPPEDAFLVSDMYSVTTAELPPTDTDPPYKIQLPLDLPQTKNDKRNLFLFPAYKRKQDWEVEQADYKRDCVRFTLGKMEYFVVYANPSSEYADIGRKGGTFRSKKDDRISVQIHENTLQNPVDVCFKITPDSDRLSSYRKYDPAIFEGIYAFTDILSVRYASQVRFEKKATVRLPMATSIPEVREVNALHIEKDGIAVSDEQPEICDDGTVKIPHDVTGTSSCQAVSSRPGISKDKLRKCAMFQTKQLSFVKILTFISDKKSPPGSRKLTIQVVEAQTAKQVVKDRLKERFHEIKKSRSKTVEIMRDDRVRVTTTGNIQLMGKMKSLSFKFRPSCKENCIDFNMKRVGFMSGLPFAVVSIQVGADVSHDIHFYCDYIPMSATSNLNKQTISLVNDSEDRSEVETPPETVQQSKILKPPQSYDQANDSMNDLTVKSSKVDTKSDLDAPKQIRNKKDELEITSTQNRKKSDITVPGLNLAETEITQVSNQRENTGTTLRDSNHGFTPSSDRTMPTNRSSGYFTGPTNSRMSLTSDRSLSTDVSQPSDGNVSDSKHSRQRNTSVSDQSVLGESDHHRSTSPSKHLDTALNKEVKHEGLQSNRLKSAKTTRSSNDYEGNQQKHPLSPMDKPKQKGSKGIKPYPETPVDANPGRRSGVDERHPGFPTDEATTKLQYPLGIKHSNILERRDSLSQRPQDRSYELDFLKDVTKSPSSGTDYSELSPAESFSDTLERQRSFTSSSRHHNYPRRQHNLSPLNVQPRRQFVQPTLASPLESPTKLSPLPPLYSGRSSDTKITKHPMFSEKSLHILADNIPVNERQKILLSLNVSHDKQVKVIEEARGSDTDPTFLLLKKWHQGLRKQDQGVIAQRLENALDENERADLAAVVQTVYEEGRGFRRGDFRS